MKNRIGSMSSWGKRQIPTWLSVVILFGAATLAAVTVINHWRNYPLERRRHFDSRYRLETQQTPGNAEGKQTHDRSK